MMSECRLVLVRHGETEWNRAGRIQGFQADSPLTEHGRAQARALALRLAREGIDMLYSSDLGRTRETAAPIAEATGMLVIHEAALRERSYGTLEGRTFAEIAQDLPEVYGKLRSRDPHYAVPGGESAVGFRDRILRALERIACESVGKRVAVVTHGGVLGALYRHAMAIPLEAPRAYTLANASCNRFRFSAGRWAVDAWCDTAHLPQPAQDDV
jgi:2,3-bisphosphoglycerate-dependent phosphoglycerate mutase